MGSKGALALPCCCYPALASAGRGSAVNGRGINDGPPGQGEPVFYAAKAIEAGMACATLAAHMPARRQPVPDRRSWATGSNNLVSTLRGVGLRSGPARRRVSRKVGVDVGLGHEPLTGALRPAAAIWMRAEGAAGIFGETGGAKWIAKWIPARLMRWYWHCCI